MADKTLYQLTRRVETLNKFDDAAVTDVTADSRKVTEGMVYVCIKGATVDGHDFAADALAKGAAAIVCDRDMGLKKQVVVKDTVAAYAELCAALYDHPAEKLRLIAVTGTNGKTTTTKVMKQVFESLGAKCGLIGTIDNEIGDEVMPAKFTTPDAHELQRLFALMRDAGCEFCILEASSQALAQGRLDGCRFESAVFTNLTQDHLDYHKTWENYINAKKKLFSMCDNAVMNYDDEYSAYMTQGENCRVLTYSIKENSADYVAKGIQTRSDGVEFDVVTLGNIGRVRFKIPGRISVYNAMAAAVCAISVGFDFEKVIGSLSSPCKVKGRLEVVPTDRDFTVMIDYAHTPDGLEKVITTVRDYAEGRVVTLFGCGGDRDRTKRPLMGSIATSLSDFSIITSDNPRTENPADIINDILAGVTVKKSAYKVIENRVDAIKWAISHAQSGDVIILAGKGHETYQILGTETIHLDEREVVAEALGELKNQSKRS